MVSAHSMPSPCNSPARNTSLPCDDCMPVEASSVLRLIRAFLASGSIGQPVSDALSVERAGVLLWDLSADADAAPGLVELQLLPALCVQLDAFLAAQLPGQTAPAQQQPPSAAAAGSTEPAAASSPAHHPGQEGDLSPAVAPERVVEICCGILGNLYSSPSLVPRLVADEGLTAAVAALIGELTDPAALSELCRLLAAALSTHQGCSAWLPLLLACGSLPWLLHIVSNTLHPLLLERSLQLLAALLAVAVAVAVEAAEAEADGGTGGGDAASAAAAAPGVQKGGDAAAAPAAAGGPCSPSQQDGGGLEQQQAAGDVTSQVVPQLMLHGLVPALEAVLTPAAAPGAVLQAQVLAQAQDAPTASSPAAAAAGDGSGGGWSDEEEDAAVAAMPGCHKVYEQSEVRAALVHCLAQLGQQQDAVEDDLLQQLPALPVLLLHLVLACRAQDQHDVLELLLPVLVLFRRCVLPLLRGTSVCEPQQEPSTKAVLCLHYWVCLADVLNDCGPDSSLDAVDAAWFLLAAVAPHAQAVVQELLAGEGSAQRAWAERQLETLCACMASASIPDSALAYARQCAAIPHGVAAVLGLGAQGQQSLALQDALHTWVLRLEGDPGRS